MSTNVELLNFLDGTRDAKDVLVGSATGDEIAKLNDLRTSIKNTVAKHSPRAFDSQNARIAKLKAQTDSARTLFDQAAEITKGIEKAGEHLDAERYGEAHTAI